MSFDYAIDKLDLIKKGWERDRSFINRGGCLYGIGGKRGCNKKIAELEQAIAILRDAGKEGK